MISSAFPLSNLQSEHSLMDADRLRSAIVESRNLKSTSLSDTAIRYVAALYDPRQMYEAPFVPTQTQYSEKARLFARGSFNTGTTGYGFVTARMNGASDTFTTTQTSNTSVGTAATVLNVYTNQATANNNSRYTAAQFGSTSTTLQYRVVGAALYVRYAGTELNRGGDYLLIEEPNHNDLAANYSYNSALLQDGCKRIPISNEWVHVSFAPNSITECAFTGNNLPAVIGGNQILGVLVNSAGATQPFEYEYHAWVEYAGTPCRSATISFNDPIGFDVVSGAATMYQQLDCVLGLDGFMRAIHAQMQNLTGNHVQGAAHGNWVGILPYLPMLASLAGPLIKGAGKLLTSYAKGKSANPKATIPEIAAAALLKKQAKKNKKK